MSYGLSCLTQLRAKIVLSLDRCGQPEQLAFEVVKLNSSQTNRNTEGLRSPSSASSIVPDRCTPSSPKFSVHRLEKTTPVAPNTLPTCLDTVSFQDSNFPETKDMKPLASFFDGFLETARVVTENEANGSLQTPCKHPSGKDDTCSYTARPGNREKTNHGLAATSAVHAQFTPVFY